jgi:TolB-like protein
VRSRLFASVFLQISMSIIVTSVADAQKALPDAISDLAGQIVTHVAKEQKRKIAVIPFRELGGQPTVFGTYLAERLVTDLANTGNLDLVERTTLDKILGELKLNESGAVDPNTAKQVGKLAGADAIVTGTITDLQSYVDVNCRLVDTQTGRIFAAAEARIVKDDDVKSIMHTPMSGAGVGQSPVAAPTLPDHPDYSATAEIGDFLFSIQDCRRAMSHGRNGIECDGKVTNQSSRQESIEIDVQKSYIVDNLGNQSRSGMYMSATTVVVQMGSTHSTAVSRMFGQELEPKLPLALQISGVGVDDDATSVSIVLVTGAGQGVMRNIRLRGK